MTKRELERKIDYHLTDDNLKSIIFCGDEMEDALHSPGGYANIIYNSLTFLTFFLAKLYQNYKRDMEAALNMPNSTMRIINLFDDFYKNKKFNMTFLCDLFLNLQIDSSLKDATRNNISFLDLLGINESFALKRDQLLDLLDFLKKAKFSARYRADHPLAGEDLIEFFKFFPVLSDIMDVEFYDLGIQTVNNGETVKGIRLKYKKDGRQYAELDFEETFVLCGYEPYYMSSYSVSDCLSFSKDEQKRQSIGVIYDSLEDSSTFKITISDSNLLDSNIKEQTDYSLVKEDAVEKFLISYDLFIDYRNSRSYFFNNYSFFNNDLIRNLALVISDVMTDKVKNAIVYEYEKRYKDTFLTLTIKDFKGNRFYKWDEILIFLLLEVGIYELIYFIFSKETNASDLAGLYLKFKNAFDLRNGLSESLLNAPPVKNPIGPVQIKNIDNLCHAYTRSVIFMAKELSKLGSNKITRRYRHYLPISVHDTIRDMNHILSQKNDDHSVYNKKAYKISYAVNNLLKINIFLLGFYNGLISYAESCALNVADDGEADSESGENYTKDPRIDSFKRTTSRVKEEASVILSGIANSNIKQKGYCDKAIEGVEEIFKRLIALNNNISKKNSSDNELMFYVFGRRELFSNEEIENYKKRILDSLIKIRDAKPPMDDDYIKSLYNTVIEYFDYLQIGDTDKLEDAIYPMMGMYTKGVDTRDGYKCSYFNVRVHMGSKEQNNKEVQNIQIKAIIEDHFDFNEMYYLIPNINRVATLCPKSGEFSMEKLWINPIIIPCNAYAPERVYGLTQLADREDYGKVAELLYSSDIKTYSGLFGSVDNAKIIMGKLFDIDRDNAYFSKKNIYIIKDEGVVKGVATYFHEKPSWDGYRNIIQSSFTEYNLVAPDIDDFEKSNKYFECIGHEAQASTYSLISDLIVDPNYRRQGIATSILLNLIKDSEKQRQDIVITSFANNNVALQLYSKMGFVAYLKTADESGTRAHEQYVKMILYHD